MVRDTRIKEYIFPGSAQNETTVTQYTDHVINGELLRVASANNFVGSVILKESGTNIPICNVTISSGTAVVWDNFPLTVTTGSFTHNNIIICAVGSLVSGTDSLFGPVKIYYR